MVKLIRLNWFNANRVAYIVERMNPTFKWICSQLMNFTAYIIRTQQSDNSIYLVLISFAEIGAKWMDADYIMPSGLSRVSHCFMLRNYSRLIPFQSTWLTHFNRYPWSFSWKLISDNLWSPNQRQFFKQLQTQTTTCNQPCTVILT